MKMFSAFLMTTLLLPYSVIARDSNIHTINVVGEANKTLKPNFLKISLGLWGKSKNAKDAQMLLAEEYKRVKKVIDEYKIKESDLKYGMYDLSPQYNWDNDKNVNKLSSYLASQSIQITYRDLDNVGKIIDDLSTPNTDSAQGSFGISLNASQWDHTDREMLESSLMSEAVVDAKAKADILAKASNIKIKGVHTITPIEMPRYESMVYGVMMDKSSAGAGASTELKASDIKVNSKVQIEYEVEND